MSRQPPRFKSDQLLSELESHVVDVVANETPLTEEEAQTIASAVAQRIWKTWGGQQIYVSKQQPELQRRDEEIAAAFQGDVDQMVRRFGLSRARIYAIIKRQRERRIPTS